MTEDTKPRAARVPPVLGSVRAIYAAAGVYGLLVLAPGLFTEAAFGRADPPPINHPEFYYGFYGSAIVWQLMFLMMARDPVALRRLATLAVLEKAAFFAPSIWLYATGRLAVSGPLYGALIDGVLMMAFLWAALRIRRVVS